jgi:hypothetical protein
MQKITGYKAISQTEKNLAWFLPRPKPDHYKGGMPLYCEEWLVSLAQDLLGKEPKMLNLFCGMNKYGFRIDLKPEVNPDLISDAHSFADKLNGQRFDFILADPPYSTEEARDIYGAPPLKYKKWTEQCDTVLVSGGLLCVYHKYVMPNPNPEKYVVEKRVFIGNRTMHLPRVAVFFRKKKDALKIAESAPSASDNSDYTAALRCTIETWSHDVGIAESIDEKGVIDLMQRLNTLKSALKTGHTRREK